MGSLVIVIDKMKILVFSFLFSVLMASGPHNTALMQVDPSLRYWLLNAIFFIN